MVVVGVVGYKETVDGARSPPYGRNTWASAVVVSTRTGAKASKGIHQVRKESCRAIQDTETEIQRTRTIALLFAFLHTHKLRRLNFAKESS